MGRSTPLERDLQKFLDEGGTEEALLENNQSRILISQEAITIAFDDEHGAEHKVDVSELLPFTGLREALTHMIGLRVLEIRASSLDEELGKLFKFTSYLQDLGNSGLRLGDITNQILTDYCTWLDDLRSSDIKQGHRSPYAATQREGGKPLATMYKREIYRVLISYLRRLRLQDAYADLFRPELDLHAHQTWKIYGRRRPTTILTRPQLKMLVRLCREEVTKTTRRLDAFRAIVRDQASPEDRSLVDPVIVRELQTMVAASADLPPPCRDEFRKTQQASRILGEPPIEFSRQTCPTLWGMNGPKYQNAVSLLYPSPRTLLPFCLLFGIYFRYNPDVLASLKATDLKKHAGVLGDRIHGEPFKNRAGRKQHASWPVTNDAHNPLQMIKTIERWTEAIRGSEPEEFKDHLFLYRNNAREVRSFAVIHGFKTPLSRFIKDYHRELTTVFTIRSIRPSVIDLVHHLFDGDVVAASHAGHHRRVDTTIEHYLQDGARKRNDEGLVPVVHSMTRWIKTDGIVDPRNSAAGTFLGATPGWECRNPYLGAIAGEAPGELCRAYGRCPSCELRLLPAASPVAYALNVKLREAVLRARTTMVEHAWLTRWQPIADLLDRTLELAFTEQAKDLADLDVPDLPTVE